MSFNGYTPKKHLWQYPSFDSAKLSDWQEEYIMARVGDLYGDWNVSVTTDENLFYTYPKRYRVRCVITRDTITIPAFTWFGLQNMQVAGRAEINSLALKTINGTGLSGFFLAKSESAERKATVLCTLPDLNQE